MKTLYIIRGLPGAGKSTLAKDLTDWNVAADDWFDIYNNNKFDYTKLNLAHDYCKHIVLAWMESGVDCIAVHNTFTTEKEIQPYNELAEKFGYRVSHIIVENRHGSSSVHNVPKETIDKMKNRFSIVL